MLSQMFRAAQSSRSAAAAGEARLALEAADIPSFWRTLHEAQGELRRARRYEHPLSLLVVGVDGTSLQRMAEPEATASSDSWFLRRFECAALLVLGWILRDATRETDAVSYAAENHVYVVLLPETDASGAESTARRLTELFEKRASVSLAIGTSTFPQDGFTVEDLFQKARSALAEKTAPAGEGAPTEKDVAAGKGEPVEKQAAAKKGEPVEKTVQVGPRSAAAAREAAPPLHIAVTPPVRRASHG